MKGLRKYIYVLMASATLLTSCHETFPYLSYDLEDPVIAENSITETPIQLYISPQTFSNSADSRAGTGALDQGEGLDKYYNKYSRIVFHTFAFRSSQLSQMGQTRFDATYLTDSLRNNCLVGDLKGYSLGTLSRPVRTSNTYDTSTNLLYFYKDTTDVNPTTLYYNTTKNTRTGYNFYTYTTDGAEVLSGSQQSDRVVLNIKLDGTNDVMCGHAPALTSDILDSLYVGDNYKSLTDEERDTIIQCGGYSAYAARRNVHPQTKLTHLLTRLRFQCYACNEDADGIIVDSIKVFTNAHLQFTVAARDFAAMGVSAYRSYDDSLYLHEKSVDGIKACQLMKSSEKLVYHKDEEGMNMADRVFTPLGGEMLILPVTDFEVKICGRRLTTDGSTSEGLVDNGKMQYKPFTTNRLKVHRDGGFKVGNTYNIGLRLYGYDKILATFDLSTWKEGGDVEQED